MAHPSGPAASASALGGCAAGPLGPARAPHDLRRASALGGAVGAVVGGGSLTAVSFMAMPGWRVQTIR